MNAPQDPQAPVRKASFWQTARAVGWSFIGVRKNSEFQADTGRLNPFHIVVVGIVGAVIFVLSLIALVNWVVAK